MAAIKPPVLIQREPSIRTFYFKIKKINPTVPVEDIFKWIEKYPNVCMETLEEFKDNIRQNMYLAVTPIYLSGGDDALVRAELKKLDDFLAGKYMNDINPDINKEWKKKSTERNKLTNILFDELKDDLSKITIKS